MASSIKVYIAGVGISPLTDSSAQGATTPLISAATKALLDAGVTYDDITRGVISGRSDAGASRKAAFDAFDRGVIAVEEVRGGSELRTSFGFAKDQGESVLMIAVEKSAAIAFVLVSDKFLWRRPYLKDSAALIRDSASSHPRSKGQAGDGLYGVCKMIWALRGWSQSQAGRAEDKRFYCQLEPGKSFELSRADGKPIPEWKHVEHKHDGKHRLGYNPAYETREISQEDFEAVRAGATSRMRTDDQARFKRSGGDRAALARL